MIIRRFRWGAPLYKDANDYDNTLILTVSHQPEFCCFFILLFLKFNLEILQIDAMVSDTKNYRKSVVPPSTSFQ